MRRILVDYARSRNVVKRGGAAQRVSMEEAAVFSADRAPDLVALDDALNSLAKVDERKSRVVELRFFGGVSGVSVLMGKHLRAVEQVLPKLFIIISTRL